MTCLNLLRSSLNSNSSSNQKDLQVEEITSPISLVLVIHRDTITLWLQAFTKPQEKAHSRPSILANKATSGCLKPFSERVLVCRSLFILEGEELKCAEEEHGRGRPEWELCTHYTGEQDSEIRGREFTEGTRGASPNPRGRPRGGGQSHASQGRAARARHAGRAGPAVP